MAEIVPFRGLRYNSARFGGITPLIAPPYDVISPALQDELYARHENNVVRVDFGKAGGSDTDTENRYTRAAAYLKGWLDEGVLVRDETPSLYYYVIDYVSPETGEPGTLSGFICMLKLEEWDKGVVLPHEGTLKGPKKDRQELLRATAASASQVFSLYSDPHKKITKAMTDAIRGKDPDASAVDDDGATHRLWVVSDMAAIETARGVMEGRPVFIADGHHRYETALAYRDECAAKGGCTGREYFNYVPMFLSNLDEEGLTVLPTHRLISHPSKPSVREVLAKAGTHFDVEQLSLVAGDEEACIKRFVSSIRQKGKNHCCFGFYHGGRDALFVLTFKGGAEDIAELCPGRSVVYCGLDVTILHALIVKRVLGLDTETENGQPVKFEKDGKKAIQRVRSGEFDMCFLLNATKIDEVKEVAMAGEIMPQKSTYFYPKLLSGMVIAKLDD